MTRINRMSFGDFMDDRRIRSKEEYVRIKRAKSAQQRHDKKGKDMKKFNP